MSKLKDFGYDIEQLYIDGFSPSRIASVLDCPIGFVYDWLEGQGLMEKNYVAEKPQEENMPDFG